MASGQIHIAILNPGVEITPLRLRGWLQKEAAVINNRANPGDGAILRLFLTRQLRYGLPGKKLDAILQALTEKYPAVLGTKGARLEFFPERQWQNSGGRSSNTRGNAAG